MSVMDHSSPIKDLQRLEKFPAFVSCIKSFGRSIFPPLLTDEKRNELFEYRAAAADVETKLFKKKLDKNQTDAQGEDEQQRNTMKKEIVHSSVQAQEICTLEKNNSWGETFVHVHYPTNDTLIAISKIPSSSFCSTVHKKVIVCPSIIGNNEINEASHYDTSNIAINVNCVKCAAEHVDTNCCLCHAQHNHAILNCSPVQKDSTGISEAIFDFEQKDVLLDDERSSVTGEAEGSSIQTVICNKNFINDTDTESNATCLTQSTDLEKYMNCPFEFTSPDADSLSNLESKATSLSNAASRSDDLSSETMVNTEGELTPCASVLAELADNMETQSTANDEIKYRYLEQQDNVAMELPGRAHSVDSYMKLMKTCAKHMRVRKSQSEPLSSETEFTVERNVGKCRLNKTSVVREDSKEEEELEESEKRSYGTQLPKCMSHDSLLSHTEVNRKSAKHHIRRNSYTLEHPSSVLVEAHADCSCNTDSSKDSSPHCSPLVKPNCESKNSAFKKEKIHTRVSPSKAKKFRIINSLSCTNSFVCINDMPTAEIVTSPINDKNEGENLDDQLDGYETKEIKESNEIDATHRNLELPFVNDDQKTDKVIENENHEINPKHLAQLYHELQEDHKKRVQMLFEEQNKQWLKLQEEFQEQERLLCEKLKLCGIVNAVEGSQSASDQVQTSQESSLVQQNKNIDVLESKNSSVDACEGSHANANSSNHSSLKNSSCDTSNCSTGACDNTEFISVSYSSEISSASHATASSDPVVFLPTNHSDDGSGNALKNCSSDLIIVSNGREYSIKNCDDKTDTIPVKDTCNALEHFNISSAVEQEESVESTTCERLNTISECANSPENSALMNGGIDCDVHFSYTDVSAYRNECLNKADHISHPDVCPTSPTLFTIPGPHLISLYAAKNMLRSDMSLSDFYMLPVSNTVAANDVNHFYHLDCTRLNLETKPFYLHPTNHNIVKKSQQVTRKKITKASASNELFVQGKSIMKKSEVSSISNNPELLKKFEKLPALVKGYLTRRLFKTERIKGLKKTLEDTVALMNKLTEDLRLKGNAVSEQDLNFQRQLTVQLLTTVNEFYDIFCTISTKERMKIISESRNYLKQQIRNANQDSSTCCIVASKASPPLNKNKLSSATLKSLERKKRSSVNNRTYTVDNMKALRPRSSIDCRTYTVEDFKGFRSRSTVPRTSCSSPSSVYRTSVGVLTRKKTCCKKTVPIRRSLHFK